MKLPMFCECGALLMGGATEHRPGCWILDLIEKAQTVHLNLTPTRNEGCKCPRCGELLDGSTNVGFSPPRGKPQPKPGDFAVCVYCGAVNCYDAELKLRELTESEREEVAQDPDLKILLRTADRGTRKSRRYYE